MAKWKYEKKGRDRDAPSFDKIRRNKRTVKKSDLEESDFIKPIEEWTELETEKDFFIGRVVEVHKRYAFVSPEEKERSVKTRDVWLATIARKYLLNDRMERNLIAVGDRVLCQKAMDEENNVSQDLPSCAILHQAPRQSKISRTDPADAGREHILAANVDQLVIIASFLHPKIRWGLIDRYLVLAEEQRIPAIIILNKRDLLEEAKAENEEFFLECQEKIALYKSLQYPIFSVSTLQDNAKSGALKDIKNMLKDKISILSGHSGVGKSSLANLFAPEIVQDVEENPDIFYKGRHTTSYASMIKLGIGGYIVDTPGIRSFLLASRDQISLTDSFIEFRPFLGQCKFRECRHIDEPGCAVLEAIEEGKINEDRYGSYLNILTGKSSREGRVRDDY
ncbi:MAG: ribosome small subunit-dependent GTPase A [Oligoflexales bacterium]